MPTLVIGDKSYFERLRVIRTLNWLRIHLLNHSTSLEYDSHADIGLLMLGIGVVAASMALGLHSSGIHAVTLGGQTMPDLCPFHQITGLWCPGCGLTRAFVSMGHGDIATAIQMNPLGPFLFALAALQIPYRAARLLGFRSKTFLENTALVEAGSYVLLISLILLWTFRIVWGMEQPMAMRTTAIPPSNWPIAGILLSIATLLLLSGKALQRFMPKPHPQSESRSS